MMRRKSGSAIVECAAGMVFVLPVLMAILFVALEVCQIYVAQNLLDQGAREAARQLAIAYATNPNVATSRSLQDNVFTTIKLGSTITNSTQFANPTFQTTVQPLTVSVTVTATPNLKPDILHLGSLTLTGTSVYRLE